MKSDTGKTGNKPAANDKEAAPKPAPDEVKKRKDSEVGGAITDQLTISEMENVTTVFRNFCIIFI